MLTLFDLETFSTEPSSGRIAQFAAVRVDESLDEIGEPCNLFCEQSLDTLPSPRACAITGLLPTTLQNTLRERAFSESILKYLEQSPIRGGFNTHRFDSVFLRFLFFRNFLNPYALEGNGARIDFIDMLRTLYALRPSGLIVPKLESGKPTLALEKVAGANDLIKDAPHDALSDCRTTLALARLIRRLQPRLFHHLLEMRSKSALLALTRDLSGVWLHVSGQYAIEQGHLAPVALLRSPKNNRLIALDLSQDFSPFEGLTIEELRTRLYTKRETLSAEGKPPLLAKEVNLSNSPVLLRPEIYEHPDSKGRWNLDLKTAQERALTLRDSKLPAKLFVVFGAPFQNTTRDATQLLYDEHFGHFNPQAAAARAELYAQGVQNGRISYSRGEAHLHSREHDLSPDLLSALRDFWLQYCARNARETLGPEGEERMGELIKRRLSGEPGWPSLSEQAFDAELLALQEEGTAPALLQSLREEVAALKAAWRIKS